MTWAGARQAIAERLEGVTIEEPVEATIRAVHQFPRAALPKGECPCFVFALPGVPDYPDNSDANTWTRRTYDLDAGLFVEDADVTQAARILDAFREAVLDAFSAVGLPTAQKAAAITLDGHAVYMQGPIVEPGNNELFAGINLPHTTFRFRVHLENAT